jgi:simple sugar transport system permease protein
MFDGLFSSAVPLILASFGALLSELGGCLAIFIEGFINLGSFFTFFLIDKTQQVFLSCVIVFFACGAAGALIARFVRLLNAEPFITALAFNIFSEGLTSFLSAAVYGAKGTLRSAAVAPQASFNIPVISGIPFLGGVFSPMPPLALLTIFFTFLLYIMINKTRQGLELRASGFNAEAARERGLRPEFYREASWALAAAFAGLSGAAFMFRIGAFAPGNGGGRGWIALAVVFLGQKKKCWARFCRHSCLRRRNVLFC